MLNQPSYNFVFHKKALKKSFSNSKYFDFRFSIFDYKAKEEKKI